MYQSNEPFELIVASRRNLLQIKQAPASYEDDEFNLKRCTDPEASDRLIYIGYAREEIVETRPAAPGDTFEMSKWNSVFGMDLSACLTQNTAICIEMPPKDWAWCSDPL